MFKVPVALYVTTVHPPAGAGKVVLELHPRPPT